MDNIPPVTIITPSFNQGKYLEASIQSVLSQNYSNLEYFVIDGGSTDGSQDIIRKYEDRITLWVSEPDNGQAEAINKGLRKANGEIVAWLNSDDLYLKGAIGNAVTTFEEHPESSMVFSNVLSVDANTRIINTMRYGDWGLADLASFNIIGQPGVFFRREIIEQVGFLDESYQFLLDHQFWLRIALNANIQFIDDFWAAARYHSEAKNIAQGSRFGEEAFRIVEWMKEEPAFQDVFRKNKKQIFGGAYNFSARYLLDSGKPGRAFRDYMRSFMKYPQIAIKDYKRILFSLFSIFFPLDTFRENFITQRIAGIDIKKFEALLPQIEDKED